MSFGQIILGIILLLIALYWLHIYFIPWLKHYLNRKLPHISPDALEKALRSDDLLLIDIRDAKDFTSLLGHINGAINIPFSSLTKKFQNINEELRNTHIVLADVGDGKAYEAYKILNNLKLNNITILNGGFRAWLKAGKSVTEHK